MSLFSSSGIACSALLSGFGDLSYTKFYQSIFNIFDVIGSQIDVSLAPNGNEGATFGIFGISILGYSYQTMWRLINQLPPIISVFKKLIDDTENDETIEISPSNLINFIVWSPRFAQSQVLQWIIEQNLKLKKLIS